jgi:hypothetical protein
VQLIIFLHTFTAPCMCPKIDVMERECKKLEVGRDLNKTWIKINDGPMIRSLEIDRDMKLNYLVQQDLDKRLIHHYVIYKNKADIASFVITFRKKYLLMIIVLCYVMYHICSILIKQLSFATLS